MHLSSSKIIYHVKSYLHHTEKDTTVLGYLFWQLLFYLFCVVFFSALQQQVPAFSFSVFPLFSTSFSFFSLFVFLSFSFSSPFVSFCTEEMMKLWNCDSYHTKIIFENFFNAIDPHIQCPKWCPGMITFPAVILLVLETEYFGFGDQYHACWCPGS